VSKLRKLHRLEERIAQRQTEALSKIENILGLDPKRFHPLADQVLVSVELEQESRGGIIIPQAAQDREARGGLPVGLVLEVGDKVTKVKAGDFVLAPPRDAAKIDMLLWLVPEAKLLAKVDPRVEALIQPVG